MHEVAQVQIVCWELDQGLQLTPLRANSLKSLELYGQDRRGTEGLEALLVISMLLASATIYLIGEVFDIMELLKALIEADYLFLNIIFIFRCALVNQKLIAGRIVFLLDHLGLPIDGNVALLEKVFNRNGFIRLDNTATTFLHPIALRAAESLSVHRFENEWIETSIIAILASI